MFQEEHRITSGRRVRDLYAVRQLLVRLQKSEHADRFKLKGGMYVGAVLEDFHRTTRDADVLDRGRADPIAIKSLFEGVADVQIDDGVRFFEVDTRLATRRRDGYDGVRVELSARVAGRFATANIDIGYGDAVVPEGGPVSVPPMFDGGDELVLPAYSLEAFLAEKAETVMSGFPGKTLIRLKDFYDLSVLTSSWEEALAGDTLVAAFGATFGRRRAATDPAVFDDIRGLVAEDRRMEAEWTAFKQRSGVLAADMDLRDAIDGASAFATPILEAISSGRELSADWFPGRGWVQR